MLRSGREQWALQSAHRPVCTVQTPHKDGRDALASIPLHSAAVLNGTPDDIRDDDEKSFDDSQNILKISEFESGNNFYLYLASQNVKRAWHTALKGPSLSFSLSLSLLSLSLFLSLSLSLSLSLYARARVSAVRLCVCMQAIV
jgi:hypothetical protein